MRYLGWLLGLLGVLCAITFGAGWLFLAERPDWLNIVGGVGALLIGVFFVLDWKNISDAGRDQTVTRSVYAGLATLLVLGITVTANMLGHRYNDFVDLTENKRFSLSPQSIDVVSKLDRDVQIIAFFTAGTPEQVNFRALMETYGTHTSLLKVEYHDPFAEPALAQQMNILSASGTVILKVGESEQRLESKFDEEAFTNALIRATAGKQHPVCVITGHGELDHQDSNSVTGLGFAATRLEGTNYTLSAMSLTEAVPTPETCAVLILAGPQKDLLPSELDRIAAYVAAGGKFVAMLDPLVADQTAADMSRYGIAVGKDIVIENDPNRQIVAGDVTFVVLDPSSYDFHPLTEKLRGVSVLRLVRSVSKGPELTGVNVQELARTSEASWAETQITDSNVPAQPDEGQDKIGKVPVVVVAEVTDPSAIRTTTAMAPAATPGLPIAVEQAAPAAPLPAKAGGKVIVFGDSDFANNQMVASGVNLDLLLNTVAWVVGEDDQLSIRPNEAGKGKLEANTIQLFLVALISLLVVPGLTIAGAIGTWVMRRRM